MLAGIFRATIRVFLGTTLLLGSSLTADSSGSVQKLTVAKVEISFTNLKGATRGRHAFQVDLLNGTYYPVQIETKLILLQQSPMSTPGDHMMEVAACPISLKLAPVAVTKQTVYCEAGFFSAWKFEVTRMYQNGKLVEGATADSSRDVPSPSSDDPKMPEEPSSDDADSASTSREGIAITITRVKDEIKDYKTFEVTLKNSRKTGHSVSGEILLNDNTVKEPAGARGKCSIYAALPAGATQKEKIHCKEKGPSNSYSVRITRIFEKIHH